MAKRRNLGDLNSDNWDEEDEQEDKGNFRKAPENELKGRVIMTGRRRIAPTTDSKDAPPAGIFSGFGGFTKTPTAPASLSSTFSFLNKTPTNSTSVEEKKTTDSDYHNKVVQLNKSLLSWVQSQVEKNPLCILTPIFDDYAKHLKDIKKHNVAPSPPGTTLKGFSFGTTTASVPKTPETTFGNTLTATASTGFAFGGGAPFKFGNIAKQPEEEKKEDGGEDEEEDKPPKNTFTPVVEEDSVFSKRCKVFIKNDEGYKERGIGTLFLKSINDGKKIQMIVRADTSLGNVLVNLMLTKDFPAKIMGKTNVMMVCIPSAEFDKPVTMLLKVKNAAEAEELLNAIETYATD